MTRHERLVRWLATVLPEPIAAAPERVLINFACALIGLATLAADQPSTLWPPQVAYAWAVTMLGGGTAALVGYWNNPTRAWAGSLERVGYLAIGLAALLYGIRLIVAHGWAGAILGGIFLGIAVAKSVRLLVSSAARDHLLRSGEEAGDGR